MRRKISRSLSRNEREPSFEERFEQLKQCVLPEGEYECVSNSLVLIVSVRIRNRRGRKSLTAAGLGSNMCFVVALHPVQKFLTAF